MVVGSSPGDYAKLNGDHGFLLFRDLHKNGCILPKPLPLTGLVSSYKVSK